MNSNRDIIDSNVQWTMAIVIILINCLFIFPPEYLLAKQISKYAVHWMFICLGLGIIFMFMNLEKLLYTSFISSGLIAFLLLYSYNSSFSHATRQQKEAITVAFINPTWSTSNEFETRNVILGLSADVILLEEVTPEWHEILDSLSIKYPYHSIVKRIDPYGKAIFSKLKIESIDTLKIQNKPILIANAILSENQKLYIAIVNELPSITMSDFKKINFLLDELARIFTHLGKSIILGANLNLVLSSRELRDFRIKTNLTPSRRDNNDGRYDNSFWSIFNTPKNEIFYSEQLECTEFQELTDNNLKPIGLVGRYQIKKKSKIENSNKEYEPFH